MIRASEWTRCEPDIAEAKALVAELHYSGGSSNTSIETTGLRCPSGELVGVAMWLPASAGTARWGASRFGVQRNLVCSLSRLVIRDSVPKGAASFLLSRSIKNLRRSGWELGVTYADPIEGHTGGVYLAANWVRDGESTPRYRWVDHDGRIRSAYCARNLSVAEMVEKGWTRRRTPPKPRFIYPISRQARRSLRIIHETRLPERAR